MKISEMERLFELHSHNYGDFGQVANKRSRHKDIHAMLLLEELFPESSGRMITDAEADVIWIGPEMKHIVPITEPNIIELIRCGVIWDEDYGFKMYA